MELKQLRYFQVVAKHQHMTRAANELHISQPSLSKTIATLEAEIGADLFDRISGGIMLNAVGQQFLARIDRSLMELEDAVREAGTKDTGRVTFAAGNASMCEAFMYRFIRAHPSIFLRHYPMPYKRMREALEKGDIDFALTYDNLTSNHISWDVLASEQVLLLVSNQHPLAGQDTVDLCNFKDERFIFNNSDFGIAEIGSSFCRDAGFEPKLLFEGDAPKMALRLVADGLGVMFMSAFEYQWHTEPEVWEPLFSRVKAMHIQNPVCSRDVGVAYLKNHYLSPSTTVFLTGLQTYFNSFAQS